jgi:preprotein translocase subunit SecF
MTSDPSTKRVGPSLRTRTITSVLMVLLAIMIVMDIFARRRAAAAAVRSERDISLVVR